MDHLGGHVCEGKTSQCQVKDGSCRCKQIAAARRSRSNVMCTDGDYCQKVKGNFLKSFIQHGIRDDCRNSLIIAIEEVIEIKGDFKTLILLLLALEKYDNC